MKSLANSLDEISYKNLLAELYQKVEAETQVKYYLTITIYAIIIN